ncbi:hypothetical protein [Aquimarina pacifica]|uniref:hypothetical protein n=1 Tax=Aquimarina pacifica TaxID=1296415 RepID=UPI000471552C|nr:hypothetical protein [Aquimarina pacifica]
MKYYIYTVISSLHLFISCTTEDFTPLEYPLTNDAFTPSTANLLYPTRNLICTNKNLEFNWSKSSPRTQGTITYDIQIAVDREFDQIAYSTSTSSTSATFNLETGTSYFWRVKAQDSRGGHIYSSIQTFSTEAEASINIIPSISSTISPSLGEIVQGTTTTLNWKATDADNDVLSYDVYFGDSFPPMLLVENVDTSSLEVDILANTTYYWKIVAKDDKQGAAIGPDWNFSTN